MGAIDERSLELAFVEEMHGLRRRENRVYISGV